MNAYEDSTGSVFHISIFFTPKLYDNSAIYCKVHFDDLRLVIGTVSY